MKDSHKLQVMKDVAGGLSEVCRLLSLRETNKKHRKTFEKYSEHFNKLGDLVK